MPEPFFVELDAAKVAITGREELIGNDLVASIDRILDSVSSRRQTELAALAGKSCQQVGASLPELETQLRCVRAVVLVSDGRLYCSSALGAIDVHLVGLFVRDWRCDKKPSRADSAPARRSRACNV
ncbi:CSS-motif domain-containing protein [Paraburkholderia sp. CNPSo 3274]|uniref:CSS-motif domain-containing protein n=1 Tax=Paraburkholderia sp. CNPSo 3274 TaxID=2940932 RepID=UPI0020B7FAC4|nr:CSS-motif domain-containing protein [Paraburkholderia sp. CNPSo 3274]MCP3711392.1 CSS-motif domain-containing protein [Paraburkholderia sp. CNPSo 3274]